MDIKDGDIVASVAILREGQLSRVNEVRSENGQPAEVAEAVLSETIIEGEMN
jgi:hypothetical protein